MADLTISPLTPSIGAVVQGLDLAADLADPAVAAAVKRAFCCSVECAGNRAR